MVRPPEKSRAERWLPIISGQRQDPLAICWRTLLWPLSYLYRFGVALRNRRFEQSGAVTRVPVPVISVGNLTTGGTGKTPMVQWICRQIRQRDIRVGLISRGYGATEGGSNDEALELELALPDVPHLQDPDRVKIAEIAIEEMASQILVMDDGFQHRRLYRDLDLVLIDATNPLGYGYCLPRGLLREPPASLSRADALVITRADQVSESDLDELQKKLGRWVTADIPMAVTTHSPCRLVNSGGNEAPLSRLDGQPVAVLAGIGNPAAFSDSLTRLGATIVATQLYPDHHAYQRDDIESMKKWMATLRQEYPSILLMTTRKDLVKLNIQRLAQVEVWALEIQIEFQTGESEIIGLLESCLQNCPADTW